MSTAPEQSLEGARALVTGAGSGIGRATALALGQAGVLVAALDVAADRAAATAAAVEAAGGRALAVGADVGDDAAVRSAVELTSRHFGGLDVLVNNAGIDLGGTLAQTAEDDWDRLFAVNVKGVFLCSRAAQPHLERSGRASVVNIASIVALVGVSGYAAYTATKGAVLSLTRAMAVDLAAAGVRVNAVCPGLIRTPMAEQMLARRGDGDPELGAARTVGRYPLKRLGTPEDVASAVLYLAGPASGFVTGTVLTVDGGMSAQ